jgi:hypothetical protein
VERTIFSQEHYQSVGVGAVTKGWRSIFKPTPRTGTDTVRRVTSVGDFAHLLTGFADAAVNVATWDALILVRSLENHREMHQQLGVNRGPKVEKNMLRGAEASAIITYNNLVGINHWAAS